MLTRPEEGPERPLKHNQEQVTSLPWKSADPQIQQGSTLPPCWEIFENKRAFLLPEWLSTLNSKKRKT